MRSRVSVRRVGEWLLRVLSLAILIVFLTRAWTARVDQRAESAAQATLDQSLVRWSLSSPARIHVSLDSVLPPTQRDWLAAIGRGGSTVTWDAPKVLATGASVFRVADPAGVSELSISAPNASVIWIRQPDGATDSISAGPAGARVNLPGGGTGLSVTVGTTTANIAAPDSVVLRKLLVEGTASWETKFTIAALAERGWKIDALTHVAPGIDMREGDPAAPDTARYAAIIAIDSTASLIARGAASYVREGGGLLTLHDAATVGPRGQDPVVLERRREGDVRAFRIGSGRVIRIGYADLWRQRMHGDDSVSDPVAAHRAWLARAVASVAYAPRNASSVALRNDSIADPAPLADMVDRLGPRSTVGAPDIPFRTQVPSSVLFGVLIAAFLLELASRRLRGAK